jgi:hypothetical protein
MSISESEPSSLLPRQGASRPRRRALPLLVALAAWLAPGVARALPSDADRATARALAREGNEAQKQGAFALAAERFARAEELVAAPTLLLGLARAQVGLGKLVEAYEIYQRILREGVEPGSPAPFARAVEDAKHEAPALAPRIAWITIDVLGPAAPTVLVDGADVPPAALGVRRPYNPGTHTIQVSADGFARVDRTFGVTEGEAQTVTLTPRMARTAPDAPSSASPGAVSTSADVSDQMSFGTKLGIAAVGVGAGGLLVGGIAGALVLTEHATLSNVCPDGHCSPNESSELHRYYTLAAVSTASLIGGACMAATGIGLLLSTRKTASVTAYVDFREVGIGGTF